MRSKIIFFAIAAASGTTVRAVPLPGVADLIVNYISFPLLFALAALFIWRHRSLSVRLAVVLAAFVVAHVVDLILRPIVYAPENALSFRAGLLLLSIRAGASVAFLVPTHFILRTDENAA
jgi:hypothetical protein